MQIVLKRLVVAVHYDVLRRRQVADRCVGGQWEDGDKKAADWPVAFIWRPRETQAKRGRVCARHRLRRVDLVGLRKVCHALRSIVGGFRSTRLCFSPDGRGVASIALKASGAMQLRRLRSQ